MSHPADAPHQHPAPPLRRRMVARDPHEPHRLATPLELLFDLCFVVAIAQAAAHLHHGLAGGHVGAALLHYALTFFAIWWAWMNFTWFASAYDTDDVPYRLLSLVQVAGVLVLAAGVSRAFEEGDITRAVLGYALMRAALVAQWLRAACADPPGRRTALRYAVGILVVQGGWGALLLLPPELRLWGWAVLVPAELLVPLWAEWGRATPWHGHHIVERYGLLALIVLGESVLSATTAIQVALDDGHGSLRLLAVIVGGLLLIAAMWWLYFDHPRVLRTQRDAFIWGYGHVAIFAALAAVGAGLGVGVDAAVAAGADHTPEAVHSAPEAAHGAVAEHGAAIAQGAHGVAPALADAVIAVPVAVYLLGLWLLVVLPATPRKKAAVIGFPLAAMLILAAIGSGWAVLTAGVVSATLVALLLVTGRHHSGHPAGHPPGSSEPAATHGFP